jgi:hypothetical protein
VGWGCEGTAWVLELRAPRPQGMILQISGSLPSLSSMEMACDYGNDIRTVARVPGPAYDHQIAYCNLLPQDQFPPFPPHQGEHWGRGIGGRGSQRPAEG